MSETRKVPFINVTRADMKPVARELARIADALEMYLVLEHNYHTRVPAAVPDTGEEKSSIDYYSDFNALKNEVEDAIKGADAEEEAAPDV